MPSHEDSRKPPAIGSNLHAPGPLRSSRRRRTGVTRFFFGSLFLLDGFFFFFSVTGGGFAWRASFRFLKTHGNGTRGHTAFLFEGRGEGGVFQRGGWGVGAFPRAASVSGGETPYSYQSAYAVLTSRSTTPGFISLAFFLTRVCTIRPICVCFPGLSRSRLFLVY